MIIFWRKLGRRGKAPRYFIWNRRGLQATGVDPRLFDPVPSGDTYHTMNSKIFREVNGFMYGSSFHQ